MKNEFRVKSKDYKWLTDCAFSTRKRETILIVDDSVSVYNTFWDGKERNGCNAFSGRNRKGIVSSIHS